MTDEDIKLVLEIINTALVFVGTLAIVITAIIAIRGINVWRKEFQGKRKIELAEDVLALFYEARDAISAIRSVFNFEGEGSTRKPQENETSVQKEAKDRAYVVHERVQKYQNVFNKLHSKRYQFMARFGCEKTQPFDSFRRILLDILISADELAPTMIRRDRDVQNEERLFEQEKKLRAIIKEYGVDDPIKPRLEKVISDIEAICKPIIIDNK